LAPSNSSLYALSAGPVPEKTHFAKFSLSAPLLRIIGESRSLGEIDMAGKWADCTVISFAELLPPYGPVWDVKQGGRSAMTQVLSQYELIFPVDSFG
jgi:hypothetical protein